MSVVADRPLSIAWKPFLALFLLGLLGAVVLFLMAPAAISPVDLVLLALASVAGTALAHRIGLRSFIAESATSGGAVIGRLRPQMVLALAAGLGAALLLTVLDFISLPLMGVDLQELGPQTYSIPQLVLGMSYGGITEEVLLRWGLMTLLAWLGMRVRRQPQPGDLTMWSAVLLSAVLFGTAHLPALAAAGSLTTVLVLRTVLLNSLAGIIYGWLFWRRSLEAAMIAHAATHVGFFLFIPLLSFLLVR